MSLKLLGILIAGILAILSTQYKLTEGNGLTKWGYITRYAILISVILSVTAQSIETYIANEKSEESKTEATKRAKEAERILSEINRSMQPIKDIGLYIKIKIPNNERIFSPYFRRVHSTIDPILNKIKPISDKDLGKNSLNFDRKYNNLLTIGSYERDQNKHLVPSTISFDIKSPLFPSFSKDSKASYILIISSVDLRFYKNPIQKFTLANFMIDQKFRPDLQVHLSKSEAFLPMHFSYDVKKKEFYIVDYLDKDLLGREEKSNPFTIPDLSNAQIVITISEAFLTDKDYLNARAKFEIEYANLRLGSKNYWLLGKDFKKNILENGRVIWEYIFPENIEELATSPPD